MSESEQPISDEPPAIEQIPANEDEAPILDTDVRAETEVPIETVPTNDAPNNQVNWWVWVLLVAALLAVSSAATALRTLATVPPLLKASWRLQCTSIILFIGYLYHLHKLRAAVVSSGAAKVDHEFTAEVKSRYFTYKTSGILLLSGTALAVHFGCWVASLNETSLAHSLLFVTCHPIIIVLGSLVLRLPISKGEVLGSIVGFIGLVITLLDTFINPAEGGDAPSFFGDFLAFLGALAIIVYLYAGRNLRAWVSLYMYAFPVTFISAVLLGIASLIIETPPPSEEGRSYGLFGWFSSSFILMVLYMGIGPGFVGHTGINTIIKYLDPVVISVTLLMEPAIGAFMGYFAGVSTLPGLFTFLGGPVIIAGCIWVTVAAHKRSQAGKYVQLDKANDSGEATGDIIGVQAVEMQDMDKPPT